MQQFISLQRLIKMQHLPLHHDIWRKTPCTQMSVYNSKKSLNIRSSYNNNQLKPPQLRWKLRFMTADRDIAACRGWGVKNKRAFSWGVFSCRDTLHIKVLRTQGCGKIINLPETLTSPPHTHTRSEIHKVWLIEIIKSIYPKLFLTTRAVCRRVSAWIIHLMDKVEEIFTIYTWEIPPHSHCSRNRC